jgi:hypothetical protein
MSDPLAIDALERLGQQFQRLEERAPEVPGRARRPRRRGPVVGILVGAALIASTSVGVAAVTGVFDRQPDGLVRQSVPRTVAHGTDGLFGAWSAVTYASDRGLCLDVTVEHNLAEEPLMSGSCGGEHALARDGGGLDAPKTFLYGLAPYEAAEIRVQAEGRPAVTVPAHPIDRDTGSFFFVSIAAAVEAAKAVPLARDGAPVGPPVFTVRSSGAP